jgi:ribonuclease R
LGDEFEGVVTGVTSFGIFVQLPEYLVEGLLRFTDLQEDWWDVDAESGYVVGQRTGKRITIGDRLSVSVAAVDLAARKLDLALVASKPKRSRRTGRQRAASPRRRRR